MVFTQETIPKSPKEASEIMAGEIFENLENYKTGERNSFFVVFCPEKGPYSDEPSIHDYALELFLDGLDIQEINNDGEFLVLANGMKLFFHELTDQTDGRIYQITFSSEPIAI